MYKKCKRFVCYIDNSDIMVIFLLSHGAMQAKNKKASANNEGLRTSK